MFTQVFIRKWKYRSVSDGQLRQNLTKFAISNPKPDLYNIIAQTYFGENPLMFTQVIIRKEIRTDGRTDVRQTDEQTAFPTILN